MADNKRFYWIKLRDSFLTSDAVDFLMGQKNGSEYVVLYQMLCLKTANTKGVLAREIGEIIIPYNAEKIQRDCKYFSIDTVHIALELYKKLGLIYEQADGFLKIADFERIVGSETKWAEYKRIERSSDSLENVQSLSNSQSKICPANVQQEIDIEKEYAAQLNSKNKDKTRVRTREEIASLCDYDLTRDVYGETDTLDLVIDCLIKAASSERMLTIGNMTVDPSKVAEILEKSDVVRRINTVLERFYDINGRNIMRKRITNPTNFAVSVLIGEEEL